jgi:hypothetical protein
MHRLCCAAAVLLVAPLAPAAEPLTPGYRAEERIGHTVCETVVTGPNAGRKMSLVCHYGRRPVAMIFVRELSPAVVCLLKDVEEAIRDRPDDRLGAYVVLLCDDEGRQSELKALAERARLQHVTLALLAENDDSMSSAGQARLRAKLGKEAAVTVVLSAELRVRASHAFRTAELQDRDIARALADFAKLAPKKD